MANGFFLSLLSLVANDTHGRARRYTGQDDVMNS